MKSLVEFYSSYGDEPVEEDPQDGQTGFAFWHSANCGRKATLPTVDFAGLAPACQNGGFKKMRLLSYQTMDVPDGVELQDARPFLEDLMADRIKLFVHVVVVGVSHRNHRHHRHRRHQHHRLHRRHKHM